MLAIVLVVILTSVSVWYIDILHVYRKVPVLTLYAFTSFLLSKFLFDHVFLCDLEYFFS